MPGGRDRASRRKLWRPADVGALGVLVLLLGLAGGVLLALTEFLPILRVEVNGLPCPADFTVVEDCEQTGADRHSYGLILLGLLAVVMSFGAAIGRSLPAMLALAVVGLVGIGIAILADLQHVDETGLVLTSKVEEGEANPAGGLWTELAGGALALVAALVALAQRRTRA